MNNRSFRSARTETFEHTISGLLTQRANLSRETEVIRTRLAEIRNDVRALDRVLASLGYDGKLDEIMPKGRGNAVLGTGEASVQVMGILRTAQAPLSSRQVARKFLEICGQDPGDKNLLGDWTSRVSRVLRRLRERGLALGSPTLEGLVLWTRTSSRTGPTDKSGPGI